MEKKKFGSNLSLKFLVLGDSIVGKTDVLERYINKTSKSKCLYTIGIDKRFIRLEINNRDLDIFIIIKK